MEKDPHDGMNDRLRPEYDLSQLLTHGVKGKYAERFHAERSFMAATCQKNEFDPLDDSDGEIDHGRLSE